MRAAVATPARCQRFGTPNRRCGVDRSPANAGRPLRHKCHDARIALGPVYSANCKELIIADVCQFRVGVRACSRSPHSSRCLAVAVRWWGAAPAWLAGQAPKKGVNRVLPHGGHGKATQRAGSVCPHPCVITQSWTDVHSFVLPWPARKQLPARAMRRS
jgi:hypothetical protein